MARRIRRIALIVLAALVAGVVVLVIAVRPRIQDTAKDADGAWKPLIAPLSTRYNALQNVENQLAAAGAQNLTVSKELRLALSDWSLLRVSNNDVDQSKTANRLEGLAMRAETMASGTDRLKVNQSLQTAFLAFAKTKPPPKPVATFNHAVLDYEHARNGVFRGIVANIDGYDARPTLQIANSAS
jgi:hypothetical protein